MKVRYLKALIPVFIALVIAIGVHTLNSGADTEDSADAYIPTVEYFTLEAADYEITIRSWGRVSPVQETGLASQVGGRVIDVHPEFKVGNIVKAGTILLELDELDHQPAVTAAEAELLLAQAELEEELARGIVAEQQRNPNSPDTPTLALRIPQRKAAQARVALAEARLNAARRDIENTRIKAPFDSVIKSRSFGLGEIISPGQVIAELYDASEGRLILPIPELDMVFLSDALNSEDYPVLIIDSSRKIERSRSATLQGELASIDEETLMNQVIVSIDDPYQLDQNGQDVIKFGKYVEAVMTGTEFEGVFLVPQYLIKDEGVWLIDEENKLEKRQVEIVRREKGLAIVNGGLAVGDKLVTTLPDYPTPGTLVRSKSVPMPDSMSDL